MDTRKQGYSEPFTHKHTYKYTLTRTNNIYIHTAHASKLTD